MEYSIIEVGLISGLLLMKVMLTDFDDDDECFHRRLTPGSQTHGHYGTIGFDMFDVNIMSTGLYINQKYRFDNSHKYDGIA
jgi:hypothetical protein